MYHYVTLGCLVRKLVGVPLGFNLLNIVGIVLGLCAGFILGFTLGKKLENQEVF